MKLVSVKEKNAEWTRELDEGGWLDVDNQTKRQEEHEQNRRSITKPVAVVRDVPDLRHGKGFICKREELTKGVVCAGPLALLIVGGEEESVVGSKEVNIVINFRQTRHWRKEKQPVSRWSLLQVTHVMIEATKVPTWMWATGLERVARGDSLKWVLNIGLPRRSRLQVAVEGPAKR